VIIVGLCVLNNTDMKVCKFHAKEHIDSIDGMTSNFKLILNLGGRCDCMMGFPESKCGNTAVMEVQFDRIE